MNAVDTNPYEIGLDKNAANYVPLSPIGFLLRSAFVYPDTVVFGSLPNTSTGKIQKFLLRGRAKGEYPRDYTVGLISAAPAPAGRRAAGRQLLPLR